MRSLQEYVSSTRSFREKNSSSLPWIGKHELIFSSIIARWLRTCLQEAGIDVDMLKTHSARGAACSSVAGSGVTVTDILSVVYWSAKTTFQHFYHWQQLWGCRCHLLVLQTYMLIWKRSLLKCDLQMTLGTQCLHAIGNYTRKVKSKHQHILPPIFLSFPHVV